MTGAEWVAEKLSSAFNAEKCKISVQGRSIILVERSDKLDARIGVVDNSSKNANTIVDLDSAKNIYAEDSSVAMLVSIPRDTRWSGDAMRWLQSRGITFGGVGDLMSAVGHDDDIASHRNPTLAFVDDGLRRHSCVTELEWIDSKKVIVNLRNGSKTTVALHDAYDVTISVAREAARLYGKFDVLLKTNPNGSITAGGAENAEILGFDTMKWGELFGYLAKRSRQSGGKNTEARSRVIRRVR